MGWSTGLEPRHVARHRVGGGRTTLLLLVAVLVLRSATLFVDVFSNDETCIALQAQTLLRGGELYRDTVDRKPPLVPEIYAATFWLAGDASLIAVHLVAIFVLWLTALALRAEAGERAAWLFVAGSVALLPADAMAANFEVFMLLPAVLAMWLARRHAFAAGVCIALAVLCKQSGLVMIAPVAIRLGRQGLPPVARMAAGLVLVLALAALHWGGYELYFWCVSGNGGYLATSGFLSCVLPQALGMTALVLGASAALWWLVARGWRDRAAHVDWWVWLVANATAICAGARFLGHYYLHVLPPAAAIASTGYAGIGARARRVVVTFTATVAVASAALAYDGRALHGLPDYRPLAAEIARRTQPTDRVFVWGNYPEILWAADRAPATRFVHMHFVTGFSPVRPVGTETLALATPGAYRMLLADLAAHPPALWIDTSPANLRDYGSYPITLFPELAHELATHYLAVATIDGIVVYERVR